MGQIKNIKLHIVTDIKCAEFTQPPKTKINMQIFVNGAKTDVYNVSPSIRVFDLKELIEFRSGVACENQVLTFAGRPLTDTLTLSEGELREESTINLGERLLGGKVHGSLARAGKVKGQTPKVDIQEKKKPKTGRAKRRMQYNNRFVNVVITPGRRKGPNSNENSCGSKLYGWGSG